METSGRHVETSGRHVGMSTVEALNQSVPDEFTRLCITEEYIWWPFDHPIQSGMYDSGLFAVRYCEARTVLIWTVID